MQPIPRFSEAIILHSLTQGQAKLVLTALVALEHLSSNPERLPEFCTLIDEVQSSYEFSFTPAEQQDPLHLNQLTQHLIDTLCDAYTAEREKHIRSAENYLNDIAAEAFDPDVFNLASGESIRLELQ